MAFLRLGRANIPYKEELSLAALGGTVYLLKRRSWPTILYLTGLLVVAVLMHESRAPGSPPSLWQSFVRQWRTYHTLVGRRARLRFSIEFACQSPLLRRPLTSNRLPFVRLLAGSTRGPPIHHLPLVRMHVHRWRVPSRRGREPLPPPAPAVPPALALDVVGAIRRAAAAAAATEAEAEAEAG
jgi:hypothetical protein